MLRNILVKNSLSQREAEVVELVTQGLSNKEVANKLFVTEKTIKFHLTNIYKKMNVRSRAQLIVWCMPHLKFNAPEEAGAGATEGDAGSQGGSGMRRSAVSAEGTTIPAGRRTVFSSTGEG